MLGLLWFAVANLLIPLLWWSAVFTVIALLLGLPVARWGLRRLRVARAQEPSRAAHAWLFRSWIAAVLFVIPAIIALVNAVPFSVANSFASLMEKSAPEAAEWITNLAADQVEATLGIQDGDTVVNTIELKKRAAQAASELVAARESLSTFAYVQNVATEQSLVLVQAALGELGPSTGEVTWDDVVARARWLMASGSSFVFSDMATGLRLAAWGHVLTAVALIAGCNLLTVLLFSAAIRPAAVPSQNLASR
jgi:hypothetical protein